MFDFAIPDAWKAIPGRRHICADDMEGVGRYTKRCGCCKEIKDESAYSIVKSNGLLRSYCKTCMSRKSTEWNRRNRARIAERKKARKA